MPLQRVALPQGCWASRVVNVLGAVEDPLVKGSFSIFFIGATAPAAERGGRGGGQQLGVGVLRGMVSYA